MGLVRELYDEITWRINDEYVGPPKIMEDTDEVS